MSKPTAIETELFKNVEVTQADPLIVDVTDATTNTIVYRFESDKPFSHGTSILSQDNNKVAITGAKKEGSKYVWSNKSKFAVNSKLVIKSWDATPIVVNGKAIIYQGKDPGDAIAAIPILDKAEFPDPTSPNQPSYLMITVGVALLALFLYIIIRFFDGK